MDLELVASFWRTAGVDEGLQKVLFLKFVAEISQHEMDCWQQHHLLAWCAQYCQYPIADILVYGAFPYSCRTTNKDMEEKASRDRGAPIGGILHAFPGCRLKKEYLGAYIPSIKLIREQFYCLSACQSWWIEKKQQSLNQTQWNSTSLGSLKYYGSCRHLQPLSNTYKAAQA